MGVLAVVQRTHSYICPDGKGGNSERLFVHLSESGLEEAFPPDLLKGACTPVSCDTWIARVLEIRSREPLHDSFVSVRINRLGQATGHVALYSEHTILVPWPPKVTALPVPPSTISSYDSCLKILFCNHAQ